MRSASETAVGPRVAMFLALSLLGLVGLLLPLPDSATWLRWLLNIAHLPLFAAWASLLLGVWLAVRGHRHALLAAACLGICAALGSEGLQALQPSRFVDARDAFSNLAGVGLGLAFGRWRWRDQFAAP
jgi:hypothetical protein